MPVQDNSPAGAKDEPRFRLFHPILAGATLKDRLLGCLGALLGITLTGLICSLVTRDPSQLPLIVAPIGASAVLLFAVPASPLAQPWPVVGGNMISAAVGMSVAWMVDIPALAVGLSVAAAIGIMSVTRSLHPPGGAVALTAALGGTAVSDWGALFPLVPVGLNSCLLVALAIAFHRIGGRSYPHQPVHPPVNLHQTDDLPSTIRVGASPKPTLMRQWRQWTKPSTLIPLISPGYFSAWNCKRCCARTAISAVQTSCRAISSLHPSTPPSQRPNAFFSGTIFAHCLLLRTVGSSAPSA